MRYEPRVFLISGGAVLAAAILLWSVDEQVGDLALFSPFYIAVVIAAWLGGLRPALLASVLSLTIHTLFFLKLPAEADLYELVITYSIYATVCLSITLFGEAIHRQKRRALQQAEQLRLAEERSARAQMAARIGVWEGDLSTGQFYFSPQFREIHGWDADVFSMDQVFASCHTEDRRSEMERFENSLKEKIEEWTSLGRFIHPQLGLRWRYIIARIQYDQNEVAERISGTVMDVTEQQVAKDLLRQVEERSSRAQEVAQAGTWELDLVQQKAYVSPEFCHLLDIPFQSQLPLEVAFEIIHPDDRPSFRRNFEQTINAGERIYKNESRHLLHNGSIKWRMARGEVLYNVAGEPISVVGATIDVTERKLAELALLQSEQRFRLATEAINGMVYDQDLTTGTVQRSEGLFELVGVRPAQAPPSEDWWKLLVHPDDIEPITALLQMVRDDRSGLYDLEYRVKHADGHWVWVNDKGRLSYNEQGELVRVVGCTTDITIRKKAELELQNADRRKDEFLATLAHELRNPLSPLQHAIDLLDDVATDRKLLSELRAMMERQMRHMVRLVDDLMDLSRISRGKIELRLGDADLTNCLNTAIEANQHLLQRLGHEVRVSQPPAPCMVHGDPERLTQIFSNLVNNAAKFTPMGGVIEVVLRVDRHYALFEVRDTGRGLDPDALEHIFEMFVQSGDRSETISANGLGIGLNLVRRLVVMHGGTVKAYSEGIGKGSFFQVKLPLLVEHSHGGQVEQPLLHDAPIS